MGLLGDGDGDLSNDIGVRGGQTMSQPVSSSQLYGPYADSWRLAQSDSLFTYVTGETTQDFTDLEFPSSIVTMAGLNPPEAAAARASCLASGIQVDVLLDACTLDLVLTGRSSLIEGSLSAPVPVSAIEGTYFSDFEDGNGAGWSSPAVRPLSLEPRRSWISLGAVVAGDTTKCREKFFNLPAGDYTLRVWVGGPVGRRHLRIQTHRVLISP